MDAFERYMRDCGATDDFLWALFYDRIFKRIDAAGWPTRGETVEEC